MFVLQLQDWQTANISRRGYIENGGVNIGPISSLLDYVHILGPASRNVD